MVINDNNDITSGGQSTCYIRDNDFGTRGTNSNSLFFNLNADDTIKLENTINIGSATGFVSNVGNFEFSNGSNIMITRLDVTAVTSDGTFLQGKLTAGDNITIEGDTISASGGSGTSGPSAHFLCSTNTTSTSLIAGDYARFQNIVFQNPTATTMVDLNNGQGYTIQEDGIYFIGFSLTVQQASGTVRLAIVYVRNGVETYITQSGISINVTEDRSIIYPLQTGDILALRYVSGTAGSLILYGSTTNDKIESNMYGYKIA